MLASFLKFFPPIENFVLCRLCGFLRVNSSLISYMCYTGFHILYFVLCFSLTSCLLLLLQVQIWASNKIHKEERSCTGKWDVQSLITSSPEFYGPEKLGREDKAPRHVKFDFRNPVRCRIIWITLRLQRPGSNSVNFGKDFNLLSLDENPFAQVNRRASFGGSVESDPCLHAKRILVVGKKVMGLTSSPQVPDQVNLKNWLERPPRLNRFKVQLMLLCSFFHISVHYWTLYGMHCN